MPKALTEEMKQQIVNLWMNYNYNQQEVADYLGIGYSTVHRIIKEYSTDGSHEPPKGMPMPERAVPAVPIEEVTQPVVMTEEHTAAIPDAVISAVESKVADLRREIQRNEEQAASLVQHNKNYAKRVEILEKWLAEVRNDSTED
ncbi:MAG: helix-turn-helix domain-containing protein [Oscillospiraceae bacterium]|nr:helix-turn-helix domain-containing protein [Oscillospiraceae bacterium]